VDPDSWQAGIVARIVVPAVTQHVLREESVPDVIYDNIAVWYLKCMTGGTKVPHWHNASTPRRPQCSHKTVMS
jgi:hypothetical protein